MVRLHSLIPVEGKLLEANYFANHLRHLEGDSFFYELSAFLSAARSVTFYVQKEMDDVPEFDAWWKEQQDLMRSDPAMKFFVDLRNISLKEQQIRMVGTVEQDPNGAAVLTYRFADNRVPVPEQPTPSGCGRLLPRASEQTCGDCTELR